MTHLKELYMGKCLDDLEQYYHLPELKKHKLPVLLKTAQKVYSQAEKFTLEGDEELGYIYFMRYFNLISFIRKMPDYSKQKEYVLNMLGNNARLMTIMDKAEGLNRSLERRYETLAKSREDFGNGYSNAMSAAADLTPTSINDDEKEYQPCSAITCQELFKLTQDHSASLLIMDCRPKADYDASHLIYSCTMNVPEEIISPGMSAGKIQLQLEPASRGLWASRSIKDQIVLMDWNCKGPEPILHTPIWRLRDILTHWDPEVTYRSPRKFLEGGYEQFIIMYPTQCTNPNVRLPSTLTEDTEMLDDIEYPSIYDITMKGDVVYGSPEKTNTISKPSIDRSSKAAALQIYDEKHKRLDVLKEKERVLEKYLNNEKKRLEAENDWQNEWQNVSTKSDKSQANEQLQQLLATHQELLYKIWELESAGRDYKLENDRLQEQLDEYKKREKEIGEVVEEKEAVNLEQRIETKMQESKQIDEQREKYTQEREKQLAFAREQKRHMKPPTEEDEISKPKMPQFDRSVKPIFRVEPTVRETRRDFSPISGSPGRGLTGLKNLGNTCYMNSIMQCLSNTTTLADYFITNTYRKHINRTNKTKGKIAEEVAALIKILWRGSYKCVASKDLRYIIGQYQQIFRGIEQQDSHEFLTILMDWLHSDLQTLQISDSPKNNAAGASEKAWLEFTKSCESYILQCFYGQIKSTVKCVECGKESATYECFSNLSLELPPMANRCDLNDCLDMYFSGEKIKGWNCPNCKQKRDAIKKLAISKLPPVLVIHFKRFYADTESIGNTYKKKQNYIKFPLEELNMVPYIARSESRSYTPKIYHLYGVSNHYGSMESGHYTAFCKSSVFKKWFKFDDQVVSSLDQSDVVSSAAYVLFYTYMQDTPPTENI